MAESTISPALFKFPRTKHLLDAGGDGVSRDDLVMTAAEVSTFLTNNTIHVEEKVDGANLGITIDEHFKIHFQNRSHFVNSSTHKQFSMLDSWTDRYASTLCSTLTPNDTVVFGEWLFAKHSVHYTRLPNYFVAFDVYSRAQERFLPPAERDELLHAIDIPTTPVIAEGTFTKEELLNLLDTQSRFYDGPVEGIYLKIIPNEATINNAQQTRKQKPKKGGKQTKDHLPAERAKIVRPDFMQHIEEQWTRQKFEKNLLENYW